MENDQKQTKDINELDNGTKIQLTKEKKQGSNSGDVYIISLLL